MDLIQAFSKRQSHLVPELLVAGADVNQVGNRGLTPLIYAAIQDRRELIRLLVEAGADVNAVREGGLTALFEVVTHGDVENLDLLLQRGADARHKNERGEGVCSRAIGHNLALRYALLTRLVAAGADLNNRPKRGQSDAWSACIHPEPDKFHCRAILGLQLQHGLKLRRMEDGQTLLHTAVQMNALDAVRVLMEKRIGLETRDRRYGFTALHFAVIGDHQEIIEFLLGAGANIEARDYQGQTPFFRARDLPFWKDLGANINAQDNTGRTVLMHLCALPPAPKPVDTSGMHPENANGYRGREAMYRHRVARSASRIQQLLELGADASIRDKKGLMALHLALESQQTALISLLE